MKSKQNKAQTDATAERNMILAMFFDYDENDDDDMRANRFLSLIDHCGVDLAACHGDVKNIPNVIAAHYRLAQGRYDIDRAAHDLMTYPPIAVRIAELTAQNGQGNEC